MMQFTPQQLQGGRRYNPKVKIGNWFEDERLNEAKCQKAKGSKRGAIIQVKWAKCLEEVPLSYSADGLLRFGDVIMLESCETSGVLACDPYEEIWAAEQAFLTTATLKPISKAVARAAFKIVPVTSPHLRSRHEIAQQHLNHKYSFPSNENGSVVNFGQGFHLVCDRGIRVSENLGCQRNPLYLASCLKSQRRASKISGHQPVYVKAGLCAETVWQFQHSVCGKDGALKMSVKEGSAVNIDEPLLVVHRGTMTPLCCKTQFIQVTDFGPEYEIFCFSATGPGRQLQLDKERNGLRTSFSASKGELVSNRWKLRLSTSEEKSVISRDILPELTAEYILKKIVITISQKNAYSVRALRAAIKVFAPKSDKYIDREYLRGALAIIGVDLNDEQATVLFDKFDVHHNGLISVNEFMQALTTGLSNEQKALVTEVYHTLQSHCGRLVLLSDLISNYNFNGDLRVGSKEMSHQKAVEEYIDLWGISNLSSSNPAKNDCSTKPHRAPFRSDEQNVFSKNGFSKAREYSSSRDIVSPAVSLDDFIQFYSEVGTGLDYDKFEALIKIAWISIL